MMIERNIDVEKSMEKSIERNIDMRALMVSKALESSSIIVAQPTRLIFLMEVDKESVKRGQNVRSKIAIDQAYRSPRPS